MVPLGEQMQDVLRNPQVGLLQAGFPEQIMFERGLKGLKGCYPFEKG